MKAFSQQLVLFIKHPLQLLTIRNGPVEVDPGCVQEQRSVDRLRQPVIGLDLQNMGIEIGIDA